MTDFFFVNKITKDKNEKTSLYVNRFSSCSICT